MYQLHSALLGGEAGEGVFELSISMLRLSGHELAVFGQRMSSYFPGLAHAAVGISPTSHRALFGSWALQDLVMSGICLRLLLGAFFQWLFLSHWFEYTFRIVLFISSHSAKATLDVCLVHVGWTQLAGRRDCGCWLRRGIPVREYLSTPFTESYH